MQYLEDCQQTLGSFKKALWSARLGGGSISLVGRERKKRRKIQMQKRGSV